MHHVVTAADTAMAVGSGDVPVLATPRLISWLEAATVEAATPHLQTGQTTVGVAIRIDHTAASAIGARIETAAEAHPDASGRRITFSVKAVDDTGQVIGGGEIVRAIVDRERFISSIHR